MRMHQWLAVALVTLTFPYEHTVAGRARRASGGAESGIAVGQPAPDFELPYLRLTTNDEGKPVGVISDTNTFRLAEYQGKKPVCLIMSSYT